MDTADAERSADEARTLALVLDELVPASGDGVLPGAGALGLAGHVARALRPQAPSLDPGPLARGLAALDAVALRRAGRRFDALSHDERVAALAELASAEAGFFAALLAATYGGYYQHARVLEALGREARPPHPKGYVLEPFDATLLDGVRRRPKRYRTC